MPHKQQPFTDGLLGYTHNEAVQGLLNQLSIKQQKKKGGLASLQASIFELRSTILDGLLDNLCKDDMRDQLHKLAGNLKALLHCTFFSITMNTYNTGLYEEGPEVEFNRREYRKAKGAESKKDWHEKLIRAHYKQASCMCDDMLKAGNETNRLKGILSEMGAVPTNKQQANKRSREKKGPNSELKALMDDAMNHVTKHESVSSLSASDEALFPAFRKINKKVMAAGAQNSLESKIEEMTTQFKQLIERTDNEDENKAAPTSKTSAKSNIRFPKQVTSSRSNQTNPATTNPASTNPASTNPVSTNPVKMASAKMNSAKTNSVKTSSAKTNSAMMTMAVTDWSIIFWSTTSINHCNKASSNEQAFRLITNKIRLDTTTHAQ
jgi:hypothetical protein